MPERSLGVDVGGTFTDVVAQDERGLTVAKVPSTPSDQAEGVAAGLARAGVDPAALDRFVHGTTVATNAVLERTGARTVLVVTEGFRDLLEIARQNRPKLYDLFADRPEPLIRGELVVEAPERVAADGTVLGSFDDDAARQVAEAVRRLDPEAVAVCLLFSFLQPGHEQAISRALGRAGAPVSLSSDVLPVFREYERASTTALNAYVQPVMSLYLASLERRLRQRGVRCEVEVMRSGGGTFSADLAARSPVHTLLSGPAAGAWGAATVGRRAGFGDLVAFDMGGTSTDATLIEEGRPRTTSEGNIGGLPFAVSSAEIHTVGAGGGSVAWRDPGGALRVGPRSAGADPGPACYGKGGTEPTVTDAYLLLGMLDPSSHLGGSLELHPEPANEAMGRLASSLGMEPRACADGVLRVLEAQVSKALRVVSVERGRDPRRYALLAFGGAGPLHQGPLARELGFSTVIVPRYPGVLSALGLLASPAMTERVRTNVREATEATAADLAATWEELASDARQTLSKQGVESASMTRSADCRYQGQGYELEVAAPERDAVTGEALAEAFVAAHEDRYGYPGPGQGIEIVNLRVRAEGPPPRFEPPEVPAGTGADGGILGHRAVVVAGQERDCVVFDRDALGRGDRIEGPAVVAGVDSTCLILPGQTGTLDGAGNLIIREG